MIAIIKCIFPLWITYLMLLMKILFLSVNCLILTVLFTLRKIHLWSGSYWGNGSIIDALMRQIIRSFGTESNNIFTKWLVSFYCYNICSTQSWGCNHWLHNGKLILVTAVLFCFVLDLSICCVSGLLKPASSNYYYLPSLSAKPHGWQDAMPHLPSADIVLRLQL